MEDAVKLSETEKSYIYYYFNKRGKRFKHKGEWVIDKDSF